LKTATDPEQLAQFVSSGTDSVAAYEAYLRGGTAFTTAVAHGSSKEMLESKAAHERAIQLDPGFALPHARLASFWRNHANTALINSFTTGLTREAALEKFEQYIDKAIELETSRARGLYYRSLRARTRFQFSDALALLDAYLREYPNDRRAQTDKMILHMELGLHDAAGKQIRELEERNVMDAALMVWSLIAIRYQDDPEQTRRLIDHALTRHRDRDLVLYQVHRARLGLGETALAAEILPLIGASRMPRHTYFFATLRQACAESNIDEARSSYDAGLQVAQGNPGRVWLLHSIMGNDDAAEDVLRPYDNEEGLSVLSDRLQYAHFDHRRFPYMTERLGDELATRGEPRPLPYRCEPVPESQF